MTKREDDAATLERLLEERIQLLGEHATNGTTPSEEQANYFHHLVKFYENFQKENS